VGSANDASAEQMHGSFAERKVYPDAINPYRYRDRDSFTKSFDFVRGYSIYPRICPACPEISF
jgi:hypothetical protein